MDGWMVWYDVCGGGTKSLIKEVMGWMYQNRI